MFPDKIEIKGNQDTPGVIFDKDNNVFLMTGRSFPADADSFYQPLLKWLEDFNKAGLTKAVEFEVKLEYFNTASAKMLLDIFFKLEDISEAGFDIEILWYYLEDDEDMEEAGEEFNDIVEINFELIEYDTIE
ncbi:MAG: DUF1987 domain-containing protein [Bacteroidales bacterium]|nr:DUF1987 domain-containing protein [Bacteroidales bacterium]